MRKVIQSTLISLDGVVDDVSSWGRKYFDPAWWRSAAQALEACDALLLGRNTYEMLAERSRALDNAYPYELDMPDELDMLELYNADPYELE